MRGTNIRKIDLVGLIALVMGREGKGLHRLVRENCDGLLRIPVSGRLDSLNVATAAGILMYEVRRQQDVYMQSATGADSPPERRPKPTPRG